jgi:cell division septation protein DedD
MFTISAASSIAWNWQTQFLVSFVVSPSGEGTISPSGTNTWQDAGSISLSATPFNNYKFVSWSTDTGSIAFGYYYGAFATATISGPGNITANFAVIPAATPTPTPVSTPTPTKSPTSSPTPASSPSPSPTAGPSSSPKQSQSAPNNDAVYIYGSVAAVILVVLVGSYMFLVKRKAK